MSREVHTARNVRCTHETQAAFLCEIDGKEHWIPKSQILEDSDIHTVGDMGDLCIPLWLAEEKNL